LNAFALCRGDPRKIPREVVRHFNNQVRHGHKLPLLLCRTSNEEAKPAVGSSAANFLERRMWTQ
jgi:hypothetical protein